MTDFTLARESSGALRLTTADGTQHPGVVPVRAFPLAAPDEGISLVSSDGHEVGWIADLKTAPASLRDLLQDELALRDFMPVITRLVSVSSFGTPSVWQVETDRGTTSFVLKGEEDIRPPHETNHQPSATEDALGGDRALSPVGNGGTGIGAWPAWIWSACPCVPNDQAVACRAKQP